MADNTVSHTILPDDDLIRVPPPTLALYLRKSLSLSLSALDYITERDRIFFC